MPRPQGLDDQAFSVSNLENAHLKANILKATEYHFLVSSISEIRLAVLKFSDSTAHRKESWQGQDGIERRDAKGGKAEDERSNHATTRLIPPDLVPPHGNSCDSRPL